MSNNLMFDPPIVAIDFDGTIVESIYPDVGNPKNYSIFGLNRIKKAGWRIAIWSCRGGKDLEPVKKWLDKWDLEVDAINDNSALTEEEWEWFDNHDSRKIAADVYVDDRNLQHINDWRIIISKLLSIHDERDGN